MTIIRSLLLVVELLCSLMLIGLILLQKSKGGGLGVAFGGGGEGSMFGSRTGNVLTKATIVLGLVFLLNTLVLGVLFTRAAAEGPSSVEKELMREVAEEQPAMPEQSAMPVEPGNPSVPAPVTVPEIEVEQPVAPAEPSPEE